MGTPQSFIYWLTCRFLPAFIIVTMTFGSISHGASLAVDKQPPAMAAVAVKQVNVNELLNFLAENHGKVILVNFFAAFCGPCRKEIPELMRLRKEIPEKDLLIVGVAIDETIGEASRFIKSLGIQDAYPVFYGGDEVSRAYRIDAIPFNVVYNRQGRIEASEAGYVPITELKKFLMTLIRR